MTTRSKIIRSEVIHLACVTPFSPFEINLENGDRIVVEHPELIAYDPRDNGVRTTQKFAVITNEVTVTGTFDAVTSVAAIDRGEPLGGPPR